MSELRGPRAFRMRLRLGAAEEYRKRHDEIWPELAILIRQAGARDYSIHLDADGTTLFAVVRENGGGLSDLNDDPLMRRWWHHMEDLMIVDDVGRPVAEPLELLFFLP